MSTIYKEALDWVVLRSKRELNDEERAAFDKWYAQDARHRGAYLRATAINTLLDQATVQESLKPHLGRLEFEWANAPWKKPATQRRTFLAYAAAVSGVAALAELWPRDFQSDHLTLQTAKGEFRRVPLADRSVANINGGSYLEVKLTSTARQVNLQQGEAWFEVAKDKTKPFIVEAGDVRVRAVGTAFSVRRYDNGAEVLVTEGKVEVWSAETATRRRLLIAGDHAFVPDQPAEIAVLRQPHEVERKLAWREGELIFKNQTLSAAVDDFNRYSVRKIVIVDPNLREKTLVGRYQIDEPERFARDVSAFLAVPIAITPDKILIGDANSPQNRKPDNNSGDI